MRPNISRCLGLFLLVFEVNAAMAAPVCLVQRASGDVWIYSRTERARHLKAGEGIDNGVSIFTVVNSSVLLRFQDGQIVVLQSNSMFRVFFFFNDTATTEKSELS